MRIALTITLGLLIGSPCIGIEIENNAPYAVELGKSEADSVRVECAIALQGWAKPTVYLEFGPKKAPVGRVPVETSGKDGIIILNFTLPKASIDQCRVTATFSEPGPDARVPLIASNSIGNPKRYIDLPLKAFLPAKEIQPSQHDEEPDAE